MPRAVKSSVVKSTRTVEVKTMESRLRRLGTGLAREYDTSSDIVEQNGSLRGPGCFSHVKDQAATNPRVILRGCSSGVNIPRLEVLPGESFACSRVRRAVRKLRREADSAPIVEAGLVTARVYRPRLCLLPRMRQPWLLRVMMLPPSRLHLRHGAHLHPVPPRNAKKDALFPAG